MNPSADGKAYPPATFTVDPARVRAFARAIGQDAPGVPATFITAAEFTVIPGIAADPELDLDFTRVLHAEQSYEIHRPLEEGETLTVHPRIERIRMRGTGGFLTLFTELTDAEGKTVAVARSTLLEREPGE